MYRSHNRTMEATQSLDYAKEHTDKQTQRKINLGIVKEQRSEGQVQYICVCIISTLQTVLSKRVSLLP